MLVESREEKSLIENILIQLILFTLGEAERKDRGNLLNDFSYLHIFIFSNLTKILQEFCY